MYSPEKDSVDQNQVMIQYRVTACSSIIRSFSSSSLTDQCRPCTFAAKRATSGQNETRHTKQGENMGTHLSAFWTKRLDTSPCCKDLDEKKTETLRRTWKKVNKADLRCAAETCSVRIGGFSRPSCALRPIGLFVARRGDRRIFGRPFFLGREKAEDLFDFKAFFCPCVAVRSFARLPFFCKHPFPPPVVLNPPYSTELGASTFHPLSNSLHKSLARRFSAANR